MENESSAEQHEDRGPRIPLAKIAACNPEPTIAIFYHETREAPLKLVDLKFPRDAAVTFCGRIRDELLNTSFKSFTIQGGQLQSFKDMLEWIKLSVAEGKPVHFKTIDESTPRLFSQYACVIEAASYLQIPGRDFNDGLMKRLFKIARGVQMSWDEVNEFYDKYEDGGLSEVAAASIFYAWWKGKLDEDDTPEEMKFLDLLRKEIPALDEDLHTRCEKNEAEVRQKWEDKKKPKNKPDEYTSGGGWPGHQPGETAAIGGWDTASGTTVAQGTWMDDGVSADVTMGSWAGDENVNPHGTAASFDDNKKSSWADETNEHTQYVTQSW